MTTTIRKSIFLAAPKEAVWGYLTDAQLLGKWFHPAKADLQVGQPFELIGSESGDRLCWGQVEEASPHDHMRWSFTVGPLNGEMTQVDWHLADAPGGTRLSLDHSGLPESAEAFGLVLALDKGWHGFLLQLIENGADGLVGVAATS